MKFRDSGLFRNLRLVGGVLRCRWWAVVAGYKLEDGAKLLVNSIPNCKSLTVLKWNPGTYTISNEQDKSEAVEP